MGARVLAASFPLGGVPAGHQQFCIATPRDWILDDDAGGGALSSTPRDLAAIAEMGEYLLSVLSSDHAASEDETTASEGTDEGVSALAGNQAPKKEMKARVHGLAGPQSA